MNYEGGLRKGDVLEGVTSTRLMGISERELSDSVGVDQQNDEQAEYDVKNVVRRTVQGRNSMHSGQREQIQKTLNNPLTGSFAYYARKRVPNSKIKKWVDLTDCKSPLSDHYPHGRIETPVSFHLAFFSDQEKKHLSDAAAFVFLQAKCGNDNDAIEALKRTNRELFLIEKILPNLSKKLGGIFHLKGVTFGKSRRWGSWLKTVLRISEILYSSSLNQLRLSSWDRQISELIELREKIQKKSSKLHDSDHHLNESIRKDTLHIVKLIDARRLHIQMNEEADYRTSVFIDESTIPLRRAVEDLIDASISPQSTQYAGLKPPKTVSTSKSSIVSSKSSDSGSDCDMKPVILEQPKKLKLRKEVKACFARARPQNVSCPQAEIGNLTHKVVALIKRYGFSKHALKSRYQARLAQVLWKPIIKRLRIPYGLDVLDVESRIIPANQLGVGEYAAGQGIASVFRSESKHASNLNRSELYINSGDRYSPAFIGLHSAGCCSFGIEDKTQRLEANRNRAREVLKAAALRYLEITSYHTGMNIPVMIMSLLTPDLVRKAVHKAGMAGFSQDERAMLEESIQAFEAVAEEAKSGIPIIIKGVEVYASVNFQLLYFSFGVNELSKGTLGAVVGAHKKADDINAEGMKKLFTEGLFDQRLSLLSRESSRARALELRGYITHLFDEEVHMGNMEQSYLLPEALLNLAYMLNIVPYWFCKSGTDRTVDCGIHVRRFACDMEFGVIGMNDHPYSKECYKTLFLFSGAQELQEKCRGTPGFKSRTMFGKYCPTMAKESDYIPAMYE